MKKVIIFLVILILVLIISLNILINNKVKNNNNIIEKFDELIIKNSEFSIESISRYPSIEFNNTDYVGFIIAKDKILPIEKEENLLNPAYLTYDERLIIKGTNLKNSFDYYEALAIGDKIQVINMLGEKNEFEIKTIKRVDKNYNIDEYSNNLILIIKNYNEFNDLLVLCDMN